MLTFITYGNYFQRGDDIYGTNYDYGFGAFTALSSDGNIIAISSSPWSGNGKVAIYQWGNSIWNKLGNDIIGLSYNDKFGRTLSLNSMDLSLQ